MNIVSVMDYSRSFVVLALTVIGGVAAAVSLVHAALQRPDAFPAVDRQSKVIWVSILGAATLFIWLFGLLGIFGIIGIVAVIVYLVDVRTRVDAIQNKRWFRKA